MRNRPSNAVGLHGPRAECEGEASADPESPGVDTREKRLAEVVAVTVPQTDTGGRGE